MILFHFFLVSLQRFSIIDAIENQIMRTGEMISKRNRALEKVYRRVIKSGRGVNFLSRKTIIELIKEQPAPRFYILPDTAKFFLLGLRKESETNKGIVADLRENYNRLKAENPDAKKEWLYETVVLQPAKSFYMSDHRIEEVIFQYKGRNGK